MKSRFVLFRRAGTYYCEDTTTRKQSSLKTKYRAEALAILQARNESFRQTRLNIQIARAYLTASDPATSTRTWQVVMDQSQTHSRESTRIRCARAMNCEAFKTIPNLKLVETNAEDFLTLLNQHPSLSVVHYLI